jgi:hypothetical protein
MSFFVKVDPSKWIDFTFGNLKIDSHPLHLYQSVTDKVHESKWKRDRDPQSSFGCIHGVGTDLSAPTIP